MALLDLWEQSPEQLRDKHVQQIIAFAGNGKLVDGGDGSHEFRAFLAAVPSTLLRQYAAECMNDSFTYSGFCLQDIVNEVGNRLGYTITPGRYRGSRAHLGFDGLWIIPDGHGIVVEVKTTDAYRIDLNTIAAYRKGLVLKGEIEEERSSLLVVVGRQDTGDLEAQIRGSRHAWDVRLISVDALLRLLALKEDVEDPQIVGRIHEILIPREFTRLDEIVDILFSTAEEMKQEEIPEEPGLKQPKEKTPKFVPVAFHSACVERIEEHLKRKVLKRTRAKYSSADGSLALTCAVSKEHGDRNSVSYWFAFHPHQREFLDTAAVAYAAFGCGSENQLILIPFADFEPWLEGMWITYQGERFYWHVSIYKEDGRFVLHRKKGEPNIDASEYLLP